MKIIIYSHPLNAQTGFGTVVRNLVKHLRKEHEIFILPVSGQSGSPTLINDIPILSCPATVHDSVKFAKIWAKHLNADLIIQHFDVWMLPPNWIKEMPCPVITYAPVDCSPLPQNFREACEGAIMNVAMSRHAQSLFTIAGMRNTYIPHGVDLSLYSFKADSREKYEMPKEAFIVGCVATNGSLRKNIAGQMFAFNRFAADKPNAIMFFHTQPNKVHSQGINVSRVIERFTLLEKFVFPDPDLYSIGIHESLMPYIYSCFDVLLQCTLGEGFGLPIIEAQACGVPVIGTNCSAITEVIGAGGLTVEGLPLFMPYYLSNVTVPDIDKIVDSLNQIYSDDILRANLKKRALENAKIYDWNNIFKMWDDLLAKLF